MLYPVNALYPLRSIVCPSYETIFTSVRRSPCAWECVLVQVLTDRIIPTNGFRSYPICNRVALHEVVESISSARPSYHIYYVRTRCTIISYCIIYIGTSMRTFKRSVGDTRDRKTLTVGRVSLLFVYDRLYLCMRILYYCAATFFFSSFSNHLLDDIIAESRRFKRDWPRVCIYNSIVLEYFHKKFSYCKPFTLTGA